MTGVRELQEDEGWDIFLQWSCKKAHYTSTHSFNRNLKTPEVCTCGGLGQLLETNLNQSWHANMFSVVQSIDPHSIS